MRVLIGSCLMYIRTLSQMYIWPTRSYCQWRQSSSLTVKIRQVGQSRYEHVSGLDDGTSTQWTGFTSGGACAARDNMATRKKHVINGGVHADSAREGVDELSQFIAVLGGRRVGLRGFERRRPVDRGRTGRRRDFVLFFVERATSIIVHFSTSPLYVEYVFLPKWRIFVKYRYNRTLEK